jgi:hypothetical protein
MKHSLACIIMFSMPWLVSVTPMIVTTHNLSNSAPIKIEDGPVVYVDTTDISDEPKAPEPIDLDFVGDNDIDIIDENNMEGSLIMSAEIKPQDPFEFKVYALGDLHGDLHTTTALLKSIDLLSDEREWIGGSSYLIQLGDIADRGPDSLALYELFYQMAGSSDGRLVQLNGNHEIMNMDLVYSYEHPNDAYSIAVD